MSKNQSIIALTAGVILFIWTSGTNYRVRRIGEQCERLEQKLKVPVSVSFIDEETVRNLGGTLVSEHTENMIYFRAQTAAKTPHSSPVRVPINGIRSVFTALNSIRQQGSGTAPIPVSIVPEIGVYEGKLALMGAIVVTTPKPPEKEK